MWEEVGLNTKLKEMNVDYLFKAILSLQTMEECYNFFDDLCTVPELKALSQRLEVATATISRVNRSLNYGSDGYKAIFERVKE